MNKPEGSAQKTSSNAQVFDPDFYINMSKKRKRGNVSTAVTIRDYITNRRPICDVQRNEKDNLSPPYW